MAWADIGDVVLRYRLDGASGRPVLLVHEMGGTLESWDLVVPSLSKSHRVVTLDQRNCGLSEFMPGPLDIDDLSDDLARLIGFLEIDEPVLVAGVAVGAAVALNFAARHPQMVSAVLALSPAVSLPEERKDAARARAKALLEEGMRPSLDGRLASSYPPALRGDNDRFEMVRRRRLAAGVPGMAAQTRMLADMDISDALGKISCPVVCLAGTHDGDRPPPVVKALAERIPTARYREVASGHFMPLQTPDIVLQAIDNILAETSSEPRKAGSREIF